MNYDINWINRQTKEFLKQMIKKLWNGRSDDMVKSYIKFLIKELRSR
jgi:hypothetical protein